MEIQELGKDIEYISICSLLRPLRTSLDIRYLGQETPERGRSQRFTHWLTSTWAWFTLRGNFLELAIS